MEGLYNAKIILDKSVTRRKLAEDVIRKLEEGGNATNLTSDDITDGYTRDGYTTAGDSLKENLDGISDALVENDTEIQYIKDNCECFRNGTIYQPEILSGAFRIAFPEVKVGDELVATIPVAGLGLREDIQIEPSSDYTVEKSAGWDDLEGGNLIVKFKPTKTGRYRGAINLVSKKGNATLAKKTVYLTGEGKVK